MCAMEEAKKKFKDFRENVKGTFDDIFVIKPRIKKFENNCNKLMVNNETFKFMYPEGYDHLARVKATPTSLAWLCGDGGAFEGLSALKYGTASKLATQSLKLYKAFQFGTKMNSLKDLSQEQVTKLTEELEGMGVSLNQMSKELQESLAPEVSKLFSKAAVAGSGVLAATGAVMGAGGLVACEIVKPFIEAGWACWMAEWPSYMTFNYALALDKVVFFGPSNYAILSAGTIIGWVGLALAVAGTCALLIKKFYDKYKEHKQYKKDVELLKKMEENLSKIEKALNNLQVTSGQYDGYTEDVEKFLKQLRTLWDPYINDEKKKMEKKEIEMKKKNKEIWQLKKIMDSNKIKIARIATNMVVRDKDDFNVKPPTEADADKIAEENIKILMGENDSSVGHKDKSDIGDNIKENERESGTEQNKYKKDKKDESDSSSDEGK